MKQFLEAMLKFRAQCDTIVWNTTLELLLRKDLLREELQEKGIDESELESTYRSNIMSLLRMPKAQYDVDQALVLVQMHNFEEGQLFLYERLQMHEMMLKLYINAGDVEHAIQLCKEHKTEDSSLWTQLLIIYSEMDSLDTGKLNEVLNYIYENRIISPLLALQLVSKNPKITLGGMRNFLIHCIEGKRQMIEEDRSKVEELRKDVESMEAEMEDIKAYLFFGMTEFLTFSGMAKSCSNGSVRDASSSWICLRCTSCVATLIIKFGLVGADKGQNCVDLSQKACPYCVYRYQYVLFLLCFALEKTSPCRRWLRKPPISPM